MASYDVGSLVGKKHLLSKTQTFNEIHIYELLATEAITPEAYNSLFN
jgi:hypothetical protein